MAKGKKKLSAAEQRQIRLLKEYKHQVKLAEQRAQTAAKAGRNIQLSIVTPEHITQRDINVVKGLFREKSGKKLRSKETKYLSLNVNKGEANFKLQNIGYAHTIAEAREITEQYKQYQASEEEIFTKKEQAKAKRKGNSSNEKDEKQTKTEEAQSSEDTEQTSQENGENKSEDKRAKLHKIAADVKAKKEAEKEDTDSSDELTPEERKRFLQSIGYIPYDIPQEMQEQYEKNEKLREEGELRTERAFYISRFPKEEQIFVAEDFAYQDILDMGYNRHEIDLMLDETGEVPSSLLNELKSPEYKRKTLQNAGMSDSQIDAALADGMDYDEILTNYIETNEINDFSENGYYYDPNTGDYFSPNDPRIYARDKKRRYITDIKTGKLKIKDNLEHHTDDALDAKTIEELRWSNFIGGFSNATASHFEGVNPTSLFNKMKDRVGINNFLDEVNKLSQTGSNITEVAWWYKSSLVEQLDKLESIVSAIERKTGNNLYDVRSEIQDYRRAFDDGSDYIEGMNNVRQINRGNNFNRR